MNMLLIECGKKVGQYLYLEIINIILYDTIFSYLNTLRASNGARALKNSEYNKIYMN